MFHHMFHHRSISALMLALCILLFCTGASAQISVKKKELQLQPGLDKQVSHVLVILQDGDVTDTLMLASVHGRTGRAVMTRVDCATTVHVPEAGDVPLSAVYALGDRRSKGYLVMRTLNTLLALNVSTYVALDIARLPEIVRAVDTLNLELTEQEAQAMGLAAGRQALSPDEVLTFVRLRLEGDDPARSRGYDALMQLLYQGLNSSDLFGLMGLGQKLLSSMDTNLNPMSAMTMVSAVQGGSDRRELLLGGAEQMDAQAMRDALHREVYQ